MTRSKRMAPVAKVAQGRERDAARVLGERQRQLAEQQQRLEELRAYRAEYARGLQESGSVSALQLRNYRLFLEQIDRAIEQQQEVVTAAHGAVESSRGRWAEVRSRAQAVDHMVERLRRQEHQEQERREQRESDERSQRRREPH